MDILRDGLGVKWGAEFGFSALTQKPGTEALGGGGREQSQEDLSSKLASQFSKLLR